MLNRHILVAFSGPWGSEKKPVWMKCRIHFPNGYPDTAVPNFSFECSPNLSDEHVADMSDEIGQISAAYCGQQLNSLEASVRYLLGERTLEENLLLLKARPGNDLEIIHTSAQSSSDEDDDDLQVQGMDMSQGTLAVSNTQCNVPLPKACGALWANDGRLVCFFPHKEEKAQSLFDTFSAKASERSARSYKTVFEGFGHFNRRSEHNSLQRYMTGPMDSDSDGDEYSYSSSGSSSSLEDMNATNQLFLPSIGLCEARLERHNEVVIDESQWSSGDTGHGKTIASNNNYVSLHDCQDLLPSKPDLARKYVLSDDRHYCCTYNARVAGEARCQHLADIWSLVDLIIRKQVPLEVVMNPRKVESILVAARRAVHPPWSRDSAIDLSFDFEDEAPNTDLLGSVRWGQHPFGQQWLVEEL